MSMLSPQVPDFADRHYHGWSNRWPFDVVVAFVMRNFGECLDRSAVRVLDLGCGSGHHLRFLAEEGFSCAGVDASESVVERTKRLLGEMGHPDVPVFHSLFSSLPFEDDTFDAVIDRGSLVCNRREDIRGLIPEIARVMKPQGLLLSTMLHVDSTSKAQGTSVGSGDVVDFSGRLAGAGVLHFSNEGDVASLYQGLTIVNLERVETRKLFPIDDEDQSRDVWMHVTCSK